ncbi:MAG: site-specific integrase [Balneolaceae bacterium]|nr:site-specific integrase [Balneolaceae bacterium]
MSTSFHLYLKKDKPLKNGEYPVYLRITSNRKHKYLSTGVSVAEKLWNPKKEQVSKTHPNSKAVNQILKSKVKKAEETQSELILYGKDNAKAIKDRLKAIEGTDFFTFAEEYLDKKKTTGKHSQLVQGTVAFNKIEEFEGSRYLPFSQIDSEYLNEFQNFLIYNHKNKPSTVKKTFQPIKAVIKRAIKDHLIHVDPFLNFSIVKNTNPPPKTKLSIEQIQEFEKIDTDGQFWLEHTRNAFLFSFYSAGIRFGDICCLKWKDIEEGRLYYQMNKNEKVFSTELNSYQLQILTKYSGTGDDYIFPFLSNVKKYEDPILLRKEIGSCNTMVNKSLKKLRELINASITKSNSNTPKITKKVTFHVSRHSFAQHAIQQGLDIYELMQTLRHAKLETTQRYLKSLNEELADEALKKVF